MPYIEGATGQPLLYAGTPSAGTDEVQLLTYTATTGTNVADSGTFTVSFEGYTTSDIAFDASAATVQTALRALPSIGTAGCSVTVAAGPPRVYTVTFDGGNMLKRAWPAMTTTSSLLQGAHSVTVVVSESVAGVNATERGAPVGQILIDTTGGVLYINTGTALAPVWTAFTATTASTAELNLIDGSIAGTAVASKALVLGANKNVDTLAIAASGLKIGAGAGTAVTATAAELNTVAGVTAGTAAASKALVADANIDITAGLRDVTLRNLDAGASGTAGTVDVFPAIAARGKLAIAVTEQTGNTTVTLQVGAMGQATAVNLPDPGAAASYLMQSTAQITLAEADVLDGATAGTAVASKALVVDANIDIGTLRNVTATGTVQGGSVTATGVLTGASLVAKNTVVNVTGDGAIAIPAGNTTYFITKAGVAAMTLVDPTATTHDGLRLTFISTLAQAHTLSNAAGSGFNGGGAASDIGTFGGAIADRIIIEAYQGVWYVVDNVNVTLA